MYRIKEIGHAGTLLSVKISAEDADGTDDTYLVGKEFFAPLGISEGDLVGEEELEELAHATLVTAAVAKALDALSYSSMSRKALTDKLRLKYKFDREASESAAEYVVRRRYLDEEADAKRIAENCVKHKKWGRRRVASELIAKGYPNELAVRCADGIDESDYRKALRAMIDKKIKTAPKDAAEYRRAVSSLIRLGHSAQDIKEALKDRFIKDE